MAIDKKLQASYADTAKAFLEERFGAAGPWTVKMPEHGSNSVVFVAHRPENGRGPSKAVARYFRRRRGLENYTSRLRFLNKHGLPAPRLLETTSRFQRWVLRKPPMIAESFADGKLICDSPVCVELAEDLGRALGKFHSAVSPYRGWARRKTNAERYPAFCLGVLDDMRQRAVAAVAMAVPEMTDRIRSLADRIEQEIRNWKFDGPFVLGHGGLGADDMIWNQTARQVVFLDIGQVKFNHRTFDRTTLRHWLERQANSAAEAAQFTAAFDKAYWPEAGERYAAQTAMDEKTIGGIMNLARIENRALLLGGVPLARDMMLDGIDAAIENIENAMRGGVKTFEVAAPAPALAGLPSRDAA
jgi:hypothetical protein